MKHIALLASLATGAVALALLLGQPSAGAFWSPISPVEGCAGIEDPMQYAQCCMQRHPTEWAVLCPDESIPDPVHDPAFISPLEQTALQTARLGSPKTEREAEPPETHGGDRQEPARSAYVPPICWAVAPGRLLCVWLGVWYAPVMGD